MSTYGGSQKQTISIFFDFSSNKKYSYVEGEKEFSLPFYDKLKRGKGAVFAINGESFFVEKEQDGIHVTSVEEIKFTSINEIKKDIKINKYIFKSDIYETIYLYEKISNSEYIKHNAKLMYFEN